ncbi:MAG TPA: BA14K family protein [Sinorhizobium sp.]|nr:BA14K family protein [Sinorhizobium sp.]
MKKIGILLLAAATAFTGYVPAQAMPAASITVSQSKDVDLVRHRRERDYRHGWYNGHRGYRYHRRGYRRHSDGWWYPLAAFGAGMIIGGAIATPAQPRYAAPRYTESRLPPRHVNWCYDRYRSYRAWDNSFQPYGGPRQQCYSPFY